MLMGKDIWFTCRQSSLRYGYFRRVWIQKNLLRIIITLPPTSKTWRNSGLKGLSCTLLCLNLQTLQIPFKGITLHLLQIFLFCCLVWWHYVCMYILTCSVNSSGESLKWVAKFCGCDSYAIRRSDMDWAVKFERRCDCLKMSEILLRLLSVWSGQKSESFRWQEWKAKIKYKRLLLVTRGARWSISRTAIKQIMRPPLTCLWIVLLLFRLLSSGFWPHCAQYERFWDYLAIDTILRRSWRTISSNALST